MSRAKAVVIVGYLYSPPAFVFKVAIENVLKVTYESAVMAEEDVHRESAMDIAEAFRLCARRAAEATESSPDAAFAAYVFPTSIEFEDASTGNSFFTPLFFLSVRNQRGEEWIYVHGLTEEIPLAAVEKISEGADAVLEERGALKSEPPKEEVERAHDFIGMLCEGIDRALNTGPPSTDTLQ